MARIDIEANFPAVMAELFKPHRYKIMYGGRGSGKSWGVARALLLMGQQTKLRILCCREFQASIDDSVHQLLSDQIYRLHLTEYYKIDKTKIEGINGTEFRFAGLKTNISQIRSFEAVNIVWCEEAATISKNSWDILIPTIRQENSEIWLTFNPELETDETYKRFVRNTPDSAWAQRVNWQDNPHFPDVLREEMEALKKVNYPDYLHVWEGQCKKFYEGAVYLDQLRIADEEHRITGVPYDSAAPVEVVFDLGWADATAIWFVQRIPGGETHFIDYYENNRKTLDFYLKVITERAYGVQTIWLPHDARAKNLGTGKSVEELIRAKGYTVKIVPQLSLEDGINALRTIFPSLWIDERRCSEGVQALRHYRYELVNDGSGGFKNKPVHDRWSHAADAARYAAIALRQPKTKPKFNWRQDRVNTSPSSWMGL